MAKASKYLPRTWPYEELESLRAETDPGLNLALAYRQRS